jgi:hypothetical protein
MRAAPTLAVMGPVFHSHQPQFVIDDDTWEAFQKMAEARHETVGELIAYAIEPFMEQQGFSPTWAALPTDITLPRGRGRRRAGPSRADDDA